MKTFRFTFNGRDRFIDAEDIFAALVEFHALYKGVYIKQLLIFELDS